MILGSIHQDLGACTDCPFVLPTSFKPADFSSNCAFPRPPAGSWTISWKSLPQVSGPAQLQCHMFASTPNAAIAAQRTVTTPPPAHFHSYQVPSLPPAVPIGLVTPPLPSAPLTLSFRQHCLHEQWSHCYLKVAYCEGCSPGAPEVTLAV